MSRWLPMFGEGPRLATRIAFIMVVPMIAIQFINFGLFLLVPKPTIQLYRSEWVFNVALRVASEIYEAPLERRQAILAATPEANWLDFVWQSSPAHGSGDDVAIPELKRLEGDLLRNLGSLVKSVSIVSVRHRGLMPMAAHVKMVPPEEPSAVTSERAVEYRSSIPDVFGLAIEGHDGTWLSISPKRADHEFGRIGPLIAGLVISGVIIAALSIFAARRAMQRLDQLVTAAERFGREREPSIVNEAGLGEFAGVARSLNEMQARLKRFVDERTRMVAAISHDLRTPLTRMKLSAEYITEEHLQQEITDGIDRMRAMIEATLAFASHDARGEAHQKTDIATLIISQVDELSDLGHALRYEGPDHCLMSCQPQMMRRAIANLLDNAVKFAPAANVTLQQSEKQLTILVRDNGPGIPSHRLQSVLEPFYRLEKSRNEDTGGFGLGLSIANDIILAHGGEVRLINLEPCGLLVEITLPVAV